jgi:DNA polymerase III delta prime subunit
VRFERPEITGPLLQRARAGAPLLLAGPPGAGKTTLLQELQAALAREGFAVVSLDLMGAASSPERFVSAALGSLPAERFSSRMGEALEIRRLAAAGRAHGAAAVHALFALWASLDEAGGRPVALLLDEATEIRSLAYFAGLRDVAKPFGEALRARRRGTILTTSFPTHAARFMDFERFDLPPLPLAAFGAFVGSDTAAQLLKASFGWPRYALILLEALRNGDGVALAWAHEMSPGGRLETACRATYESLLLRSRGYGISKALLAMIAHEEGQNLTSIYRQIGRSPGATRDYLGWLMGVDAVRMVKKRYYYVDGLVGAWVRLYGRGRLPTASEIDAAAQELLAEPSPPATEAAAPEAEKLEESPATEPVARRETLMEID